MGYYDYSYQNGQYKSPYSYVYNANTIDVSINVSTIKYSEAKLVGYALFWNANQTLPFQFDIISESVKEHMVSGRNYSFSEILNLALEIRVNKEVENILDECNEYLSSAITAFTYANSVINTFMDNMASIGDTVVQIELYGNTVNDKIIGYYRISSQKVNILDERIFDETRNVTGVQTNRFAQSYSVDEDENPLCYDRNDVLFDT